jgi:3-methyladenine DNA glycosylase/8-oxoguanine DNA glycosylase
VRSRPTDEHAGTAPAVEVTLTADRPVDLRLTYGVVARGWGDPTLRIEGDGARAEVWRASHTPIGAVTVCLTVAPAAGTCTMRAWGPGAPFAAERAASWFGLDDRGTDFQPPPGRVRDIARRRPDLRVPRLGTTYELLVAAVLEQRVTGHEAKAQWRALAYRYGEPAPGPHPRLRTIVGAEQLARFSDAQRHGLGIESSRGRTLGRVAREAARLDRHVGDSDALDRRLLAIDGIGPWTSASVRHLAAGDEDAVLVGDYHLPSIVSFALTGEVRARDDAHMLELLEPYRPHRARAARLLSLGGPWPQRRGPRMPVDGVLHREAARYRTRRGAV